MRRKTLANNILGLKNLSKEELQIRLKSVDLSKRAECFSIEEFVKMFKTLNC